MESDQEQIQYLVFHRNGGVLFPVASVTITGDLHVAQPERYLDEVFEKTNNTDDVNHAWYWNEGVTLLVNGPCRSTSVGDHITCHLDEFNLFYQWVIENVGFRELPEHLQTLRHIRYDPEKDLRQHN